MKETYNSILIMKIGPQGTESLSEIMERKDREAKILGHAYWGYGGVTCVPRRVQDFANEVNGKKGSIKVLFSITESLFHGAHIPDAKETSEDGISWYSVPKGIRITVSKYAIVLKNLQESNFNLPLNDYQVATGPSQGKLLSNYLRFRVDKTLARRTGISDGNSPEIKISFTADLVKPYAVSVR